MVCRTVILIAVFCRQVMPLSDIVDMAQKITIDVKFEVPLCAFVNVSQLHVSFCRRERLVLQCGGQCF